jgi:hypothetical protein
VFDTPATVVEIDLASVSPRPFSPEQSTESDSDSDNEDYVSRVFHEIEALDVPFKRASTPIARPSGSMDSELSPRVVYGDFLPALHESPDRPSDDRKGSSSSSRSKSGSSSKSGKGESKKPVDAPPA